jgi:hypothetical protein
LTALRTCDCGSFDDGAIGVTGVGVPVGDGSGELVGEGVCVLLSGVEVVDDVTVPPAVAVAVEVAVRVGVGVAPPGVAVAGGKGVPVRVGTRALTSPATSAP